MWSAHSQLNTYQFTSVVLFMFTEAEGKKDGKSPKESKPKGEQKRVKIVSIYICISIELLPSSEIASLFILFLF